MGKHSMALLICTLAPAVGCRSQPPGNMPATVLPVFGVSFGMSVQEVETILGDRELKYTTIKQRNGRWTQIDCHRLGVASVDGQLVGTKFSFYDERLRVIWLRMRRALDVVAPLTTPLGLRKVSQGRWLGLDGAVRLHDTGGSWQTASLILEPTDGSDAAVPGEGEGRETE